MENFDMSQFKTQEEIEAEEREAAALENEMLKQYDRSIWCEDSARIAELVQNVFTQAQKLNPSNIFFEATDNEIKWSLALLSADPSQFTIVEGLLSHRSKAHLLDGMFADEAEGVFRVLPSNTAVLKNTAFLGGIKDEKTVNNIKENVLKVAGIDITPANQSLAVFKEPINASLPNMSGYVIALINLDATQMTNLKRASKVKKVSDRVNKVVTNASTATYGIAKSAIDGIVVPGAQVAGQFGGLVVGGAVESVAKAGVKFASEMTNTGLRLAEIKDSKEISNIKYNAAQIAMKLGRDSKDDSFSFSF